MELPASTQRLVFRHITLEHADVLEELFSDRQVMKFYPRPWTRDEVLQRIRKNQEHYDEHGFGHWAVYTVEDEFVGECGLAQIAIAGAEHIEVSYHLRTLMQGRGYATEAASACAEHLAKIAGQDPIAVVYPQNAASEKVAQKIGLRQRTEAKDSKGNPFNIFSRTAL